jgi:hypothetical protein
MRTGSKALIVTSGIGCGEPDPALGAAGGVQLTPPTHHRPACADRRNPLEDRSTHEHTVMKKRSELRGVL